MVTVEIGIVSKHTGFTVTTIAQGETAMDAADAGFADLCRWYNLRSTDIQSVPMRVLPDDMPGTVD